MDSLVIHKASPRMLASHSHPSPASYFSYPCAPAITMATYDLSVFPMEIYHAILGYLRLGNMSTLGNCALVCNAWRSIVQRWMFSRLVIQLTPTHVDQVLAFFTESSPYLSKFVTTLELCHSQDRDAPSVPLNTLLRLLSDKGIFKLSINVDNLHLGHPLSTLTAEELTLLSQLAKVRELSISSGRVSSIQSLISTFPSLRSLILGSGVVLTGDSAVSSPAIQGLAIQASFTIAPTSFNLPSLHHFAFHWCWTTAIAQSLLESIPYEQIQRHQETARYLLSAT
jgi:hypothetical protein